MSRIWIAVLTVALMAIGTGAVVAQSGSGDQSAAKSEYKPGLGPCKTDGVNPSGTHTGPPGQPGKNCENRPGNRPRGESASGNCVTGSSFVVRLPKGVRRATVVVNGKPRRVRRSNGRLVATVPVTISGQGPKTIVVRGTTRSGSKVRGRRIFNPCRSSADPTVRVKKAKNS